MKMPFPLNGNKKKLRQAIPSPVDSSQIPPEVGQSVAQTQTSQQQKVNKRRLSGAFQKVGLNLAGFLPSRHLLTVDIHEGFARVVVFHGHEIKHWGTIAIEKEGNEALGGYGVYNPSQLRELLKDMRLQGASTVASLANSSAIIRRLGLPKISQRYLEKVVAAEVLDSIPFTQEQVDITHTRPEKRDGQRFIAVAVPKLSMDSHVALLKEAGCRPIGIYPRAWALSAVAGRPDTIVVDLGLASAEIVLILRGAPQAAHSLDLTEMDMEEGAEVIERLIQNMASPWENAPIPVVLTGPLSGKRTYRNALQERLAREVVSINPGLTLPGHFPADEYAVNLGLYRAYQTRPRIWTKPQRDIPTAINILPERHHPLAFPTVSVGLFLLLILLGYAALDFNVRVENVIAYQSKLASQVSSLERQERIQRLSRAQLEAAQKRAATITQIVDRAEAKKESLSKDTGELLCHLRIITQDAMSQGVRLSTLSYSDNGYAVAGSALSTQDLINYSSKLRATKAFQDVRIMSIQSSSLRNLQGEGNSNPSKAAYNISFQLRLSLFSQPPVSK